jgi:hypothetical protein
MRIGTFFAIAGLLAMPVAAAAQTCAPIGLVAQADSPVCGDPALTAAYGANVKCAVVPSSQTIAWNPSTVPMVLQAYRAGHLERSFYGVMSGAMTIGQAVGSLPGEIELKWWAGASTPCATAPIKVSRDVPPIQATCATPMPGSIIPSLDVFTTDYLGNRRDSFGRMESVNLHGPAIGAEDTVRILWFADQTPVSEAAALRHGDGNPVVEGLTTGASSQPTGGPEFTGIVCQERGGVLLAMGFARFTVY